MNESKMRHVDDYPRLIDLVSPPARTSIARARSVAMRSGADSGSMLLLPPSDLGSTDKVATGLTHAEILFLDHRTDDAIRVLEEQVTPLTDKLPDEIRLIIERNRLLIQFGGGFLEQDAMDRYDGEVDRARLMRVTAPDVDALLAATEASNGGKHFESLPIFTSALFDAYRRFDWQAIRKASARMVHEHLRLKQPIEAAFFAILSEDKSAIEALAVWLRAANDLDAVSQCLRKIHDVSHLRRHLMAACRFISALSDSVPDDQIAGWLDRLGEYRSGPTTSWPQRWLNDAAWDATKVLLAGADDAQADTVAAEAYAHPDWSSESGRHQLLGSLRGAAGRSSESGALALIDSVGPIAAAEKPGIDHEDAVVVLADLVQRHPNLKPVVRERVYKGKKELTSLLARAAPAFGVEGAIANPGEKIPLVIGRLLLQVERLEAGKEARTGLGEFMIQTIANDTGTIAVKVLSSREDLLLVAAHRKELAAKAAGDLVRAMLRMVRTAENVNANRSMLLEILPQFGDVMDQETAAEVVKCLEEYAADHRSSTHPLYGQAEGHAPLNPMRIGLGWPQEVRGAALRALTAMGEHHADLVGARINRLLADAMGDRDPQVRRDGYHAMSSAADLTHACLPLVAGGTRDSDVDAANIAIQVCGLRAGAVVADGLLPVVVGALEAVQSHPDVSIRYAAAISASKLRAVVSSTADDVLTRLENVVSRLRADVSRRVRQAATGEKDKQPEN